MANLPEKGQKLPDVEFTTEDGGKLAASELDGHKTVLYFYPRDDTPGCTKEACAFRDAMPDYEAARIKIFGVSLDSPESHRGFREKHGLTFPLLTDEGGKASEAFGTLSEKGRAKRVKFLLDEEAKVAEVYPEVTPETHAGGILADAGAA